MGASPAQCLQDVFLREVDRNEHGRAAHLLECGVGALVLEQRPGVLHADGSDHGIQPIPAQWQTGVQVLLGGAQVVFHRARQRQVVHLRCRDHHGLGLPVGKLEGARDDVGLAVAHHAAPVRIREDQLQLVFGDWRMDGHTVPQDMQDPGRQALQDTQHGLEDEVRRAQRRRKRQQISLGVSDRQHLGNLFAENDVHRRHQNEGQTDREGVRNAGWRPKVRRQEPQRLHHRAFGQPADAQAGDRDADLRQRQVVTDAIDHDDRTLGCLHALSGEFFESRPANPHDGELCRHPERVDEDEPERSCDEQKGFQSSIQHGGLLVVRSAIRGSNAGQRGKCPMAVVAAGRSRRSASALPSAANVRSIGNLEASSRSAAGVASS